MNQVIITIIPPSDATLGEFFSQFEEQNQSAAMLLVSGLDHLPNHSELAEKIKAADGKMIDAGHVSYRNINIGFQRNQRLSASGQPEPHPFFCIVSVNTQNDNRPDPDELISARAKISHFLSERSLLPIDPNIASTELKEPHQAF